MHYKHGNFSLSRLSDCPAENGDIFENVNFSQAVPNTPILSGITGLTFRKCNLVNCTVPTDAVVENCNTAKVSRCSHLHPDWGLSKCETECSHMADKDEITIDGVLVDTIYYYKDTRMS